MDFINLNVKITEAKREKQKKISLFGTDNFRSWMLYIEPGDGTDMHYHISPETFIVVEGKASIKGINGEERVFEKNEVVFFGAKDYYQITRVGSGPLVLFGNRSEAFGGPHVRYREKQGLETNS